MRLCALNVKRNLTPKQENSGTTTPSISTPRNGSKLDDGHLSVTTSPARTVFKR